MFLPVPPTVTIQQCSTPVTEGDDATLSCSATGIPAPNITWIRPNMRVLANKKMHVITDIKRNESGSYECHASNGIGNNSTKSCTIDVRCKYDFNTCRELLSQKIKFHHII